MTIFKHLKVGDYFSFKGMKWRKESFMFALNLTAGVDDCLFPLFTEVEKIDNI